VGDGLVHTSTVAARDSSVVDNRDRTPTTIVGSSHASLAGGVLHARIIDCSLSLLENGNLRRYQFKYLLSVPFANGRVEAFHQHKHITGGHSTIEILWGWCSRSSKGHGVSHYLRGIDRYINTLDDSSRTFVDPNLALEILDGSFGPNSSVRFPDGGHGGGESSIPFTLNVTFGNLQASVISNNGSRSVIVRNTSGLTSSLGLTSTMSRWNTSSVRGTSK